MTDTEAFALWAGASDAGKRLDMFIAEKVPDCSRSHAGKLILKGIVTVNGESRKAGYRLRPGDVVDGSIAKPQALQVDPQPLDLQILYQDDDLIAINKQPGVVVHPAPGHPSGTLVNALLYHFPTLQAAAGELRPGIIHRLDKDTSGVLIVAKHPAAHSKLAEQFALRKVGKIYQALVYGDMTEDVGRITLPIGRHPVERKRMSVHSHKGRRAETEWRVTQRFGGATLLALTLKTGRTHQARVHCAALHHPVVGDAVYAGRNPSRKLPGPLYAILRSARRQMLHAWRITFKHPTSNDTLAITAPVPDDMAAVIQHLSEI